jgi:O-antigen/teichoic acid export membrane protein
LLDAAQASLVLALLCGAYGSAALGAYAFALRIARTPLAIVGSSVGQVFQQRVAQLVNERGDVADLARRTTQRLALLGAPFMLLMLAAPPIFAWAFGPEWHEAGACARVLAPWMVLSFLTSPLSQLPLIVGRQGRAFAFGVAYQLAMVLPLAAAWAWDLPLLWALGLHSAAASAVLALYGVWLHRLAKGIR